MLDALLLPSDHPAQSRLVRACEIAGVTAAAASDPWGADSGEQAIDEARKLKASGVWSGPMSPQARLHLARSVFGAGLTLLGPGVESLEVLADKLQMRAAARRAGLPVVPGTEEAVADAATAHGAARQLGYPVVIKPVAGWSGIGVCFASDEDELDAAFAQAEQAAADLGDARLYMEKALRLPREIEVTVAVDRAGNTTTFLERDTSIRRHGQLWLSETPSPLLRTLGKGTALHDAIRESAIAVAQGMQLVGMVHVEFLYDDSGHFLFLEANADAGRAWVSTEMRADVDLFELQLRIASGELLEAQVGQRAWGHACEATVRAGSATASGVQHVGTAKTVRYPPAPQGSVRVEQALEPGPDAHCSALQLLGRVASYAATRHQAFLGLDRTLAESQVGPVPTNLAALRQVLNHEAFRAGQYDLGFADRVLSD